LFRQLLTFDETKKAIEHEFKLKHLSIEEIPILEASNRVLAENIASDLDIPPFSRSTVDGYAVRAEDTFGAEENRPIVLKVIDTVNIGEPPKITLGKGKSAEIVTGAPIPKGSDAVIMIEHTERKADKVTIFRALAKSENIMKAGADIRKGETILKEGEMLGSREIGVLAAVGRAKVKVYAVPRIAVLSAGPEIVEPGSRLPPGKIYDINAYSLSAAIRESGGNPLYLGIFPDKLKELQKALRQALSSSDMVITSGGVSVGPKDVVPEALGTLGKPGIIVCGIAIKPGKPTTIASVAGKPIFSLPGHPTSALLVFNLLARRLIQRMSGRRREELSEVVASASMRMFPAKGRRTFIMVRLRRDKSNRLVAEPVSPGLSGAITTLARADGFVEIAENVQFIDTCETVRVQLFRKM
jgi:putative molybdopterin biosynthesis protein